MRGPFFVAVFAAILLVSPCARAASPDADSCLGWSTALEDAKRSGDSVKIAVTESKVPGQVGSYAAVFQTSDSERMRVFLFGPGGERNRAAINAWMRQYCASHPKVPTMDGVRVLAPMILRDWAVPQVASAQPGAAADLDTCRGWLTAMDAQKGSGGPDSADSKVMRELGAYGNEMQDAAFWTKFLLGPQTPQVSKDVNAWMRRFCTRNPNATIAEGVYVLGPQIRRDGKVR